MGQPYVGEIRMFGGNFAPAGWAFCSGQLLPITQDETLFNLIGTTYGGDGQSTFALPDLRGRVPIHMGTNPTNGITYAIGQMAGEETVTLTTSQIPTHTHAYSASTDLGTQASASGQVIAANASVKLYTNFPPAVALNSVALQPVGGSQPHENMQPFLVISYVIALFGIFPSPN